MNPKAALFVLLSVSLGTARDIVTRDGAVYLDVTVTKVEATGICIMHETGAASLDFLNLSEPLQKEFGYDPAAYQEGLVVRQQQKEAVEIARLKSDLETKRLTREEHDRLRAELATKIENRAAAQAVSQPNKPWFNNALVRRPGELRPYDDATGGPAAREYARQRKHSFGQGGTASSEGGSWLSMFNFSAIFAKIKNFFTGGTAQPEE